jgi:hypothetical protein
MTLATHIRYLEVVEMKVLLSLCQIIAEVTLDLRPLNVAQHMMDQVMCDGLSQPTSWLVIHQSGHRSMFLWSGPCPAVAEFGTANLTRLR